MKFSQFFSDNNYFSLLKAKLLATSNRTLTSIKPSNHFDAWLDHGDECVKNPVLL
jgi:hypothetical protein